VSAWLRTCVHFDGGRTKRDLKAQLLGQCLTMISSTCAALEGEPSQHTLCGELVEHIRHSADADVCEKLAEVSNFSHSLRSAGNFSRDECGMRCLTCP
jgi:hypothetical protein